MRIIDIIATSPLAAGGEHKRNRGHEKELANKIAIAELKKRENAGDILSKKEKKQLNFGKKSNT